LTTSPPHAPSPFPRRLIVIVTGFALLRVALAATVPILDDEAYYWAWSRHLSLGYLDHPPAIATLVYASTQLFGDGALAIRLPSILFAAGTAIAVYGFTRSLGGDERTAYASALFLHALPVVATASFLTAPDTPMLFFWVLTAWAIWRALNGQSRSWITAGLTFGAGLLCKYSMGLLIPGMAVLGLARYRGALRDGHLYVGLAIAGILFAPNLLWLTANEFATVRYVYGRALWMAPIHPVANAAALVAASLLYLSPVLGVLLLAAPGAIRRTPPGAYLLAAALPTIVAVLQAAASGRGKPHYILPAAILGIPALALWTGHRIETWKRLGLIVGFSFTVVALAALSVGPILAPGMIRETIGWAEVRERIRQVAPDPAATVLVTGSYQSAGQIAYATRDRYVVLSPTRESAFGQWAPPVRYRGRAALIVYDPATPLFQGQAGRLLCNRHEILDPVVIPSPRGPIRTFAFIRCEGLRAAELHRP